MKKVISRITPGRIDNSKAVSGFEVICPRANVIIVGVVIAVVVYVGLIFVAGLDELKEGIWLLDRSDWAVLCGISLGHFLIRFLRWEILLRAIGYKIALPKSALIYFSGFALTTTPGKFGETWRALYLRSYGVHFSQTFGLVFVERYADLLAIMLLSMFAAGLYNDTYWPIILTLAAIFSTLLILRNPILPTVLEKWESNRAEGALKSVVAGFAKVLRTSTELLSVKWASIGTVFSIVAWGLQATIMFVVLQMVGAPFSLTSAIGIYSAGLLVGALSFLPGGVGTTEASMMLLLIAGGCETSVAASATLICRVATLWFAVFIGFLSIFGLSLISRLSSR